MKGVGVFLCVYVYVCVWVYVWLYRYVWWRHKFSSRWQRKINKQINQSCDQAFRRLPCQKLWTIITKTMAEHLSVNLRDYFVMIFFFQFDWVIGLRNISKIFFVILGFKTVWYFELFRGRKPISLWIKKLKMILIKKHLMYSI